jgi:hypothetical protein
VEFRFERTGSQVHAGLSDYFDRLHKAWMSAAGQVAPLNFERRLGEIRLRIASVGRTFSEALTQALDHLPDASGEGLDGFEILAWDQAVTGVALPEPPWRWPEGATNYRYALPPGGEAFRINWAEEEALFSMYCVDTARAIVSCRDAARLPTYVYASPCSGVFHWWAGNHGLHMLHAGCVGEDGRAALIVGPSGSGKSTTALMCAQAGMKYISDDICLLRPGLENVAICLYNAGKLHRRHLEQFPAYASLAIDPGPDREGKPVVFLHQKVPELIATELPIKAIVVARVSGNRNTTVTPITSGDALKALAPSTLFMRPPHDPRALRAMAELTRSCHCFQLELGAPGPQIPTAIRAVLSRSL